MEALRFYRLSCVALALGNVSLCASCVRHTWKAFRSHARRMNGRVAEDAKSDGRTICHRRTDKAKHQGPLSRMKEACKVPA